VIVWSYGGGIQSVAIGVLIREGALPKPDISVIADTGRERRTTWEYLHAHMQPFLEPISVRIEIASHEFSRIDLYAKSDLPIIPAYTAEGRLGAFCSGEWKRDVVMRWLRARGVDDCVLWIGYSIDELSRVPDNDRRKWCHLEFPLIDRFANRAICRRIIEAAGLPLPKKSRCWMCPHQNTDEWKETLADPIDGLRAIDLEREISDRDPLANGFFLHYSRTPLELVAAGIEADAVMPPQRACDGGYCWT
jgi:hypothetical protein